MQQQHDENATRVTGVDLAARAERTSLCVMSWPAPGSSSRPRVIELVSGVDDALIVARGGVCDGVGIDCPFGWPDGFVDVVRRHHDGESIADHPAEPRDLRLRLTDVRTRERVGRDPLSVSTDKLGIVALRGIRVLERLAGAGADRSGGAGVYEVYPAGALAVWQLPSRGYKRRSPDAGGTRETIVASLAEKVDLGGTADRLVMSDDDLDAVICAIITGLAVSGRTLRPAGEDRAVAAREGWIHLPAVGLSELTG